MKRSSVEDIEREKQKILESFQPTEKKPKLVGKLDQPKNFGSKTEEKILPLEFGKFESFGKKDGLTDLELLKQCASFLPIIPPNSLADKRLLSKEVLKVFKLL